MPNWRLILSDELDGRWNMALDEAIVTLADPGVTTVRLYGWNFPCISLGHFQTVQRAVDLAYCQEMQLPIVRRPTGGRAVLHEEQIAYAVTCPVSDPLAEGKNVEAYRRISDILVCGLALLGTRPALAPRQSGTRIRAVTSQACLQIHAQYELVVDGKKIGGSAQLRRGSTLLQHGFLMLGFNPERAARALSGRGHQSAALARQMEARATSLDTALERKPTFIEVRHALATAFREALGQPGAVTSPSQEELELAARLVNEKYVDVSAISRPGDVLRA